MGKGFSKFVDDALNWIEANAKYIASVISAPLTGLPAGLRMLVSLVIRKLIEYGAVKLEDVIDAKRDKKAIEAIIKADKSFEDLEADRLDQLEREILEGKKN